MPQPLTKSQEKDLKRLGEKVRSIRESKGMTLEEVAQKVGKDRQSIHRLEKGSFNPSYIYLTEVCKGLSITLAQLFE